MDDKRFETTSPEHVRELERKIAAFEEEKRQAAEDFKRYFDGIREMEREIHQLRRYVIESCLIRKPLGNGGILEYCRWCGWMPEDGHSRYCFITDWDPSQHHPTYSFESVKNLAG
ncbi:MAG: hypothetical protein HY548_10290 [Elusimicrobia bacterium]|nr:hypothetical protein [Elusimicrobiota bacterium]